VLRSVTQLASAEALNDLVLLRDPFVAQLAKALSEHGNTLDEKFARCIGQMLAMHIARLELPRTRVNALPKWRLRRVEEYVRASRPRYHPRRPGPGCRPVPYAFRSAVPGCDGVPTARISTAPTNRKRKVAVVEHRYDPG